jgi:hypothetical protein
MSNPVADYSRRDTRGCSQSVERNDQLQFMATQRMLPIAHISYTFIIGMHVTRNFQKRCISRCIVSNTSYLPARPLILSCYDFM